MRFRPFALFAFVTVSAVYLNAQTPAGAFSATPFEMPGVFRISLPPGWQQVKAIDDRHTIVAFSNKELTLEVFRDINAAPADKYAEAVTDRRARQEADQYTGKYAPKEVRDDPGSFVAEITHRFDEYTSIGGLPTQWARYRWHYSHPKKEGEPAKPDDPSIHDAVVWSVFTLSPGQYWGLELRGDEKASWSDDLQRMVRSFQLLDPMLSRAKTAIPKEAWNRVPSGLAIGTCEFVGVGSDMGALVPCDWDVVDEEQNPLPTNAAAATLVGLDSLQGSSPMIVTFRHVVANVAADEVLKVNEDRISKQMSSTTAEGWNGKYGRDVCYWGYGEEDDDRYGRWCRLNPKIVTEKLSYHRDDLHKVTVDGYSGTLITATATGKKTKKTLSYRLLAVTKGTDHFLVDIDFNPDACTNCPVDQILNSVHLFALRPKVEAATDDIGAACNDLFDRLAESLAKAAGVDSLLPGNSAPEEAKPSATPPPKKPDPDADRKCIESVLTDVQQDQEDARLLNDSDSHWKLGAALEDGGKHDEALAEFKTAVRINPRNAEVNRAIAKLYTARNDTGDAIAAYERILYYEGNPDSDDTTQVQLASLYAQTGAHVIAVNHLSKAGSQGPENILPDAEQDAANKQLDDLGARMEKANKEYATNPTPENSLADAELGLEVGDFPGADQICRGVYDKDPKNVRALACLADTSFVRGEGALVIDYAQQWLALAPNDASPYMWLARGYTCDPADYRKAAENYEAVIRHATPQLPASTLQEAQSWWPRTYEEGAMWLEAAKAHEEVAALFPGDGQVLNSAAWFFATTTSSQKNPAKALDYAKRAVAAAHDDPNIIDTLAEAYFVSGRVSDAITTEQKALALAPNRADLQKQIEKFKAKQPQHK